MKNDAAVLMYNNMYDGQEINGGSAYDAKSTEHKCACAVNGIRSLRRPVVLPKTDEMSVHLKTIFTALPLFPSVSSFPIVWFAVQSFHFGQHLQVHCVALWVDFIEADKLSYPALRFFAVFAVPEPAGVYACFFKAGEIG